MWFNELSNIALIGAPITKQLTKCKNGIAYQNIFTRLVRIAKNRYKIKDGTCPDTINERVLRDSMLWYGSVTFFEKEGGIIALPSRPTSDFNIYGEPGYAWVWGRNGFNQKIKLEIPQTGGVLNEGMAGKIGDGNGVFIRENEDIIPFVNFVYDYAYKLYDTSRTIDTQRFHCKRPYIITAQESVIPTVKEYFNKVKDNEEYIVGSGIFDANAVNAIPISVSHEDIKGMCELYDWYFAQFEEICGIKNNQASSKKENLIVDEVNANNEATEFDVSRTVDYLNKQMETVNKLFGTNIEWEVSNYGEEQDIQTDDDRPSDGVVSGDER